MRSRSSNRPRSPRAPLLLGALLLAASPAAAVTLIRGPYLQLLTTHSVTVVWNTNVRAACALAIRPLGGATTVIAGGTSTVCAIPVEGLAPGAQYAYVPRAGSTALTTESVFEADDSSLPYRFLVVGDTGGGTSAQFAVRDRMLATPADFILHTGDMIYELGAAADFNPKFFTPYRDLIRHLVFWPCLGNHDVATAGGQPWRDAFYTPANNAADNEGYYSFEFGNAHVAVIDSDASTSPGSPQYRFLDQDLGESDAVWNFVAFHHTIYTASPTTSVRANLVPLFDRHHVDIVFMGHVHAYERTKPLRANTVVPPGEGTVYVTTGGGGRSVGSAGHTGFTAYAENSPHFTRVAVDGEVLLLQMIRVDGAVRDSMTLVKGSTTVTGTTSTTTSTRRITTTTTSSTTTTLPSATLHFAPVADVWVDAKAPTANFGTSTTMTADKSPVRIIYLRFVVTGVGTDVVSQATLRLTVDSSSGADSASGGTLHRVGDTSWEENTVTYKNRPAIDTRALATRGAVALKKTISFDVGAAVAGDGNYSFALDTTSKDDVRYLTREAKSGKPDLVVTLATAAGPITTTESTVSTTSTSEPTTSTESTTTTTSTEPTTSTTGPSGAG